MSSYDSRNDPSVDADQAEAGTVPANARRDDTLTRLRTALLEDRLAVMEISGESTGTDPYNSGVHRAMVKAHVWNKRSR